MGNKEKRAYQRRLEAAKVKRAAARTEERRRELVPVNGLLQTWRNRAHVPVRLFIPRALTAQSILPFLTWRERIRTMQLCHYFLHFIWSMPKPVREAAEMQVARRRYYMHHREPPPFVLRVKVET